MVESNFLEESFTIYKVFDEDTDEIQLIPESSAHTIAADMVSFNAYLVDSAENEIPLGSFSDGCFTFNKETGIIDLDSAYDEYFKERITLLLSNQQQTGYDVLLFPRKIRNFHMDLFVYLLSDT